MKSILVFRLSGYLATAVAHGWPDLCMWRSPNGPLSVKNNCICSLLACKLSLDWIESICRRWWSSCGLWRGLGTFHLFPPTQLGLNSESELVIAHCTDNVYGLLDIMIWSKVFVYWYDHSWIKSEMINFASPLKYYSPILNLKPPRIWFHSSITDLATSASNSWFCFDEWNCNCVCAWCEQNWQLKPPVLMISIIWMKVNQNHTEAG